MQFTIVVFRFAEPVRTSVCDSLHEATMAADVLAAGYADFPQYRVTVTRTR